VKPHRTSSGQLGGVARVFSVPVTSSAGLVRENRSSRTEAAYFPGPATALLVTKGHLGYPHLHGAGVI
jgi:hypothetical protein